MNLNVHIPGGEFVQVVGEDHGSFPAEKRVKLVEKRLAEFRSQAGQTTVGAPVMVHMGTLSPLDHQLCYADTVHLAVYDVLSKGIDANNNVNKGCQRTRRRRTMMTTMMTMKMVMTTTMMMTTLRRTTKWR